MVERSILSASLEKLIHLSSQLPLFTCHVRNKPHPFPAILEELATPGASYPSTAWRESIANDLIRDAQTKYNSIVHTVGTVCRDLEHRCATVEQPLRKAEEVIDQLKQRLEEMEREKMSVIEECAGLTKNIEDTRKEKEELAHELRCAREEIEGCRRTLVDEREKLRREVEEERVRWKDREEELMRTTAILDDELREAQDTVRNLEEQVHRDVFVY